MTRAITVLLDEQDYACLAQEAKRAGGPRSARTGEIGRYIPQGQAPPTSNPVAPARRTWQRGDPASEPPAPRGSRCRRAEVQRRNGA